MPRNAGKNFPGGTRGRRFSQEFPNGVDQTENEIKGMRIYSWRKWAETLLVRNNCSKECLGTNFNLKLGNEKNQRERGKEETSYHGREKKWLITAGREERQSLGRRNHIVARARNGLNTLRSIFIEGEPK